MDEDERHNAYERSGFDHKTYIEFANIIQHYDEEARPPHDDIEFVATDPDFVEIDSQGFDVVALDPIIIISLILDDLIDGLEYGPDGDCLPPPYNPLRGRCKGRRQGFRWESDPDTPDHE